MTSSTRGAEQMITARRRAVVTVATVTALALLAGACGSSSKNTASTNGTGSNDTGTTVAALTSATLNESGSTFQLPYLQEVAKGFKPTQSAVTINVSGGGSGKGD